MSVDDYSDYFLLYHPRDHDYRRLLDVLGQGAQYFSLGTGVSHPLAVEMQRFETQNPGLRFAKVVYRLSPESLSFLKNDPRGLEAWRTPECKEGITFWRHDGTFMLSDPSPKSVIPMVLTQEEYLTISRLLPEGALYLNSDNENAEQADDLLMTAAANFHQKMTAKNN